MSEIDAKQLQFTINFLAAEYRLLLRGSFPDGTEIQLLLTRRLTRGMLQLVDQVSTRIVRGDIPDPAKRRSSRPTSARPIGPARCIPRWRKVRSWSPAFRSRPRRGTA